MFNNFNSGTFLVDAAITILGLAVIVSVIFLVRMALKVVRARNAKQNSYEFNIEEVGTTMADGGVRIGEVTSTFFPDEVADPSNIFRSNN